MHDRILQIVVFVCFVCVCHWDVFDFIDTYLYSYILLPLPIVHLICAYNSSLNVYTVPRVYTISREVHCTSCLIYIHFQRPSIFHRIKYSYGRLVMPLYLLFEIIFTIKYLYMVNLLIFYHSFAIKTYNLFELRFCAWINSFCILWWFANT